jgi:hypothetical protein
VHSDLEFGPVGNNPPPLAGGGEGRAIILMCGIGKRTVPSRVGAADVCSVPTSQRRG